MELIIEFGGKCRAEEVGPEGVFLGREAHAGRCVVLPDPSKRVSRKHATIYQNPLGQWTVEDLGSSNGTFVGSHRLLRQSKTVAPGEAIHIGPYLVRIAPNIAQQVEESTTTTLAADMGTKNLVVSVSGGGQSISAERLRLLNELMDRLSLSSTVKEAYQDACEVLSQCRHSHVAIVRVPLPPVDLPEQVETLGTFGGDGSAPSGGKTVASRSVLETTRSRLLPVTATDWNSGPADVELTQLANERPRTVCCTPIHVTGTHAALLYAQTHTAEVREELIDFVQAAGRQIASAVRIIALSEARGWSAALDRQLEMARSIQMALVPRALDLDPAVQLALAFEPAMWVGGDYCDVMRIADGRLAFAVGDVVGKGLPAALIMTHVHATLRTVLYYCNDPAEAMCRVNSQLLDHTPEAMFVTMFLGLLDTQTGRLDFVNAGHPLPLVVEPDGRSTKLGQPRNTALGLFPLQYIADTALLERESALLLYTDGVSEAPSRDDPRMLFGESRLMDVISRSTTTGPRHLIEAITTAVRDFRGGRPQSDDLTLLALSRTATA